jgi:hypothetical protein
MKRQPTGKTQQVRLRGREFEPPRKPDFLTRTVVVAFNDRRYGTQKGKADADGFDMVDQDGVPHAERLVDAQAARGIADQEHNFRVPKERADQVRQDAVEEQADAERELEELAERDAELAEAEAELGRRHGPGPLAYGGILLALFCLTLPIDYGVAAWTPLPPIGQWMLAIFIGVVMVLCAHQAAKKVEDLQESYAHRDDDPFTFWKDLVALVLALTSALLVLIGTTIWRGQVLTSEAQATGGPVHSGVVTMALGLLATLAFVVAVLAGMGYRRMAPLRAIRKERAKLAGERRHWQGIADRAERTQRQAEVTLAYLDEREAQVVAAIRHWATERKARMRQRAAHVARRERSGRESPGEAQPPAETPGALDISALADEVRRRANGDRRRVAEDRP